MRPFSPESETSSVAPQATAITASAGTDVVVDELAMPDRVVAKSTVFRVAGSAAPQAPRLAAVKAAHSHGRWADRLGIGLSGLCLIHCLLTPILLLLIPALEVSESKSHFHEFFHLALLVVLPVLAVVAFMPNFRIHRRKSIFAWAIPGLIAIAVGALIFEDRVFWQAGITIFGSLCLIRAHWLNWHHCAACSTHHK